MHVFCGTCALKHSYPVECVKQNVSYCSSYATLKIVFLEGLSRIKLCRKISFWYYLVLHNLTLLLSYIGIKFSGYSLYYGVDPVF